MNYALFSRQILGLVLILLPVFGLSPCLQAQVNLTNGLVAHYPFDGNAQDASGNGHHGTLFGPIYAAGFNGTPNGAIALDGVDDWIEYMSSPTFQPQLPMSISVWVKIEDYDANPIFFNNWEDNDYNGMWFNILTNARPVIAFGDGGAIDAQARRSYFSSFPQLSLNNWHHLVGIVRGPMDADIFVDGNVICGSYSGTGGAISYDSSLPGSGGKSDPNAAIAPASNFFHGSMDELRFYDRELTADEIAFLSGNPGTNDTTFHQVCMGDTVQLNAPSGSFYSWTPGTGLTCYYCPSPEHIAYGPASYQVVMTNPYGCPDTAYHVIGVDSCCALEISSLVALDPTCQGDQDGQITIAATGGNGWVEFALDSGSFAASPVFGGLPGGTYWVFARDSTGCMDSLQVVLLDPPALTFGTIQVVGLDCQSQYSGSVDLSASGGVPTYQFSWNGGPFQPSPTFNSLPGGNQTFVLMDAGGCTDTLEVGIPQPDSIQFTVNSVFGLDCHGDSDGQISLNAFGTVPPYQFAIDQGPYGNSGLFTQLTGGTHVLWAMDSLGCEDSIIVVVPAPDSIEFTALIDHPSCFESVDGSFTLVSSGGTMPHVYAWNGGPYQGQTTYGPLGAGFHAFVLSDANGCLDTLELELVEPSLLELSVAQVFPVICHSDSSGAVQLTATGGTQPYLFGQGNNSQTDSLWVGLPAQMMTVWIEDSQGCQDSVTVEIPITPDPQVTASWLSNYVNSPFQCFGDSSGQALAEGQNGTLPYTFIWSHGETGPTAFAIPTDGPWEVILVDSVGCQDTTQLFADVPPQMFLALTMDPVDCFGTATGAISARGSGGVPGYSYQWEPGLAEKGNEVSDLLAGLYAVTVTDSAGCQLTDSVEVTQPDSLYLVLDSLNHPDCDPNRGYVAFETIGGNGLDYAYTWSDGWMDVMGDREGLSEGTLTVWVVDSLGCADSATIELIREIPVIADFGAYPRANSLESGAPILLNHARFRLENRSSFAVEYLWDFGNGHTSQAFEPDPYTYYEPGTYTLSLIAYDPDRACPDTASITFTVIENGALTLPSAFSPNGDLHNQTFRMIGKGIDEIEVQIFSRWGPLVWSWEGMDGSWNGQMIQGGAAPEGVYVVVVRGRMAGGIPFEQSGTLTLIR
ncbi:LamG-like jellyroll fold domain-containing protein [Pontibacter sp. G13]|uniref:LamG-like jellyroll fold domain-containing protein n=1 Tax=Pontibacter sp. G13 TaxID=3074898 RepID=UPI00288C4279|nr:LamG-like jellyroll fold domain-containing protein [Pontibacter sp. G13]WNJ18169.1 LamG-like jellyroll fold domain-containing protein [Pontibacter sp. G13]